MYDVHVYVSDEFFKLNLCLNFTETIHKRIIPYGRNKTNFRILENVYIVCMHKNLSKTYLKHLNISE